MCVDGLCSARWLVLLMGMECLCVHCRGPEGGGNFSHVEYEADCSLMITSTQMKAEDLLPKELVLFLSFVQSSV